MAKGDAYYLKHDNDAFSDPKIIKLRMTHGFEAYALYWRILEMMFDEPDCSLGYSDATFQVIEFDTRTTLSVPEIIETCLKTGLFELDEEENVFYSPSLNRRMEVVRAYSEMQAEKGRKSGEVRRQKAKERADAEQNDDINQTKLNNSLTAVKPELNKNEPRDEMRRDEKKREEKTRDDRGNLKTIYREDSDKGEVVVGGDHEKKEKVQAPKPDTVLAEYMNIIDPLPTAAQMDQLDRWQEKDGLEPEVLIAAMHTAADNGKRSFSYLRGIVKNLIGDRVRTMLQYRKREEKFQETKEKGEKQELTPEEKAEKKKRQKKLEEIVARQEAQQRKEFEEEVEQADPEAVAILKGMGLVQ